MAWRRVQGAGNWKGILQRPPGYRIMDIGSDFVLGRHRGDGGVEEVRSHRLIKPERLKP